MSDVHYDSGSSNAFCDRLDETSVLTVDEDAVTCRACVDRLQRWDMIIDKKRRVPVAQRIDWFGDDG